MTRAARGVSHDPEVFVQRRATPPEQSLPWRIGATRRLGPRGVPHCCCSPRPRDSARLAPHHETPARDEKQAFRRSVIGSRVAPASVAGAVLGCVSTDRVKHAAGLTRHERAGGRRDPPGPNVRVRRRRRADQSAAGSHIAVAYGSRHDRAGSFSTGHCRRARRRAAPNRGAASRRAYVR